MVPEQHPSFDAHEVVTFVSDPASGLSAIIALHSTALGPAAGGCRLFAYRDETAALADALRLSKGMSYKNAMAGLKAGGGKAVILGPLSDECRERAFQAFGAAVEGLGGRYITAEDVGTTLSDMVAVRQTTPYVAGLPMCRDRAGGDPSPWTALGVFTALEAAIGHPAKGLRVAVQGVGNVGWNLCALLHAAGAKLVVSDVDARRAMAACEAFGAELQPVETIHQTPADVFAPCALGAVLNARTIPELGATLVCGGANNQLSDPDDGEHLRARGITYVPDYVVNAGGIINVMAEYNGEPAQVVEDQVLAIGDRVRHLLARARDSDLATNVVADSMAQDRLMRPVAAHSSLEQ